MILIIIIFLDFVLIGICVIVCMLHRDGSGDRKTDRKEIFKKEEKTQERQVRQNNISPLSSLTHKYLHTRTTDIQTERATERDTHTSPGKY